MNSSAISEDTRSAILDAAWHLIVTKRSADVSLVDIARQARVSRQSLYLGFGNRAGLLIAMARHADAASPHSNRMGEIASGAGNGPQTLADFVEAWLHHLPVIYPVGVLLSAAAATDQDAASVFADRMVGALYAKYLTILTRIEAAGRLSPLWPVTEAADLCWSLTHIDTWKHLVVQRGWFPDKFRQNRQSLIRIALFGGE